MAAGNERRCSDATRGSCDRKCKQEARWQAATGGRMIATEIDELVELGDALRDTQKSGDAVIERAPNSGAWAAT